jgi:hypothetical protein
VKPRRLILRDAADQWVVANWRNEPLSHVQIDLTGLSNGSARDPLKAVVQEKCNLDCWHDTGSADVPLWTETLWAEP